ncbi:MAG: 30S ribosome-binding factor RbfA [Verrucomicrobia bacterium]|nr:30S ribosome-binding factor RbfA [Verrucomicrobiota bacterium]MBS0636149.1 30S ribosome-binding factor RbfA [Verrucomicrobiota bacterium]
MATGGRVPRLNSLLKEVISEVIHRGIHHAPHINQFITITRVEILPDLSTATVFVSILGTEADKAKSLEALNQMSHQITMMSSKRMRIRHFPSLTFVIDTGLEKQMRIEELLHKIKTEREARPPDETSSTG